MYKFILSVVTLSISLLGICNTNSNFPSPKSKPTTSLNTYNLSKTKVMLSYGLGAGDYSFTSLGISVFRNINSNVNLGLSVNYFGENGHGSSNLVKWQKIPIMLEGMLDLKKFNKNRSSIFFKTGIGYSFTLNGNYYDGADEINKHVTNSIVINPGVGFRYNILENTGLLFDMSYVLINDQTKDAQNNKLTSNDWSHILFRCSFFF